MTNAASKLRLTLSVEGQTVIVDPCDLLVVACDPRGLTDVCTFTPSELAVFDGLQNYTFHTTLVRVPVPTDAARKPKFGVILKPDAIDRMEGNVSGFRNETAKQFSLETANAMTENLVTVYQLLGPEKTPMTQAQFLKRLEDTLQGLDWWPYDSHQICTDDMGAPITLTTPYFDHFDNAGLAANLPWKYLAVQGTGNTLFVHGSTCFESVLQCWQYGGMLLDQLPSLGIALPADKKAARIAVLGGGPSGMLFATGCRAWATRACRSSKPPAATAARPIPSRWTNRSRLSCPPACRRKRRASWAPATFRPLMTTWPWRLRISCRATSAPGSS